MRVHLIGCDTCREGLALYMRVLRPDTTAREDQDLECISQQWEARTVRTMPPPKVRTSGTGKRWFFVLCGVAAALVVGILFISSRPQRMPQTARDVVQILLTQSRPFEARMSGQPHLPIVRTRGIESPGVDYDLLAGEMAEMAADSYEMGRFHLLQKDFAQAIPYLETAEKDEGAPAQVHNDLGVAYMERGGDASMAAAAEEFRHALNRDAGFAAAVFNLSIFYEKKGMLSDAEREWQRYLQLDTESGWADEIRSKVEGMSR